MPDDQHARIGRHVQAGASRDWVWWSLGFCVAAYLLSPLLFSQHLEGYTANLRSIVLAWRRGELLTQDAIMPVLTQYLFYTRIGIVLLLRLIGEVFGEVGDAGFRALTVASFALLTLCSLSVARRWGRIGLPAALLAALLIPGLVDIGSFFNDNVISAGIGVAALAVVSRSTTIPACVTAGMLLGAAVLCRTDAALLGPALAGMVWLRHDRLGPLIGRGVAILAGMVLVFAVVFAVTGVTIVDALAATRNFFPARIGIFFRATIALFFLGLPALALLSIGLVLNVREHMLQSRDIRWTLLFVAYPAVIAGLGVIRLSTEVRYIYPMLVPFCLVHIGRGLEWVAASLATPGWPRRAGTAVVAGVTLLLLLPPLPFVRDGPHSLTGRMWMPLVWFRWQDSVVRSMQRINELVAAAEANSRLLVMSTHFNDDFFLKLRLLENGFHVQPVEDAFPGCRGGLSVYSKPGHVVMHIRTENQYGLTPLLPVVTRSLQIQRALQCPAVWQFDRAFMTVVGRDVRITDPPLDAELFEAVIPRLPPLDSLSTSFALSPIELLQPSHEAVSTKETPMLLRMGEVHVTPLSKAELQGIGAAAEHIMTENNLWRPLGPFFYEDFLALYRWR